MVRRLSHKQLKRILRYDPETGHFVRLVSTAHIVKVGEIAGHHHKTHRYVVITFKKRRYYAHVLAWFYMTGKWPKDDLDHRDLDRGNNRWKNLREAAHVDNCANTPMRKNNTSGYRGVSKTHYGPFRALICRNRKHIYLGVYPTAEGAALAYDAAARRLHREFASTNFASA